MNKNITAGVICAAAVAIYVVGWLLLPSLQGSKRTVEQEASVQVERARRLLHRYDPRLAYKVFLTDDLAEQGFELEPDVVSDDLTDAYQEAHGAMWAAFQPVDWVMGDTQAARANYSNLTRQISDGIRGQDQLVQSNEELLDDALQAVEQALEITEGDESSRFDAEATRLKAVILCQMGMADRTQARLYRRTGDSFRRELIALAAAATESVAARELVASSNIDAEISRLHEQTAQIDALVVEDEKTLADVQRRIAELEAQLKTAEAKRAEADAARQQLRVAGIDFSDPNGGERFRERSETLEAAFRAADRQAKQLMYGSYPNAHIDASHDYILGRYVEGKSTTGLTIRRGLLHERNDRDVLLVRLDDLRRGIEAVRGEIGRLQTMRDAYLGTQQEAVRRIGEGAEQATEIYAELNRIDAEAFTMEDDALDAFEECAEAAKQATDSTDMWLREGADRATGSSPEMDPFATQGNSRWMKGYVAAQIADARLARAWVYCDRYNTYSLNARVVAVVAKTLGLDEADSQAEREKALEAQDLGVAEVTEAMKTLEAAHKDTGRQWTLAAQAAGTMYLMTLLGHQDYLEDTIEAYRKAVQGREDNEAAKVFVSRLNSLEQR